MSEESSRDPCPSVRDPPNSQELRWRGTRIDLLLTRHIGLAVTERAKAERRCVFYYGMRIVEQNRRLQAVKVRCNVHSEKRVVLSSLGPIWRFNSYRPMEFLEPLPRRQGILRENFESEGNVNCELTDR